MNRTRNRRKTYPSPKFLVEDKRKTELKRFRFGSVFCLASVLCLVFLSILGQAQSLESQVQITVSGTVQYREPLVITEEATEVGVAQATFQGELVSLGPQSSVDVFFQYRGKDLSEWQETSRTTKTEPDTFSSMIIGLSENTTYQFRAGVEWGDPLENSFGDILEFTTGEKTEPSVPAPAPSGAPSLALPAVVVFEGRAYPNAFLTILRNKQTIATFFADSSGLFRRELTGVSAGIYTFGVWAEDSEGRKSVTLSFTVSILGEMTTTISGIFISPTIELTPIQVERGDDVNIFGQAFPKSEVKIFVASEEAIKETRADSRGKWSYRLNTASLSEREHTARARAFNVDGDFSPFSHTINFLVLKPGALVCQGADLNLDGRVNIIDFSVSLYFWGQRKPANLCADINQDGIVNIIDFSIMMYYWTG